LDPGLLDAKVSLGKLYVLSGTVAETEKIADSMQVTGAVAPITIAMSGTVLRDRLFSVSSTLTPFLL